MDYRLMNANLGNVQKAKSRYNDDVMGTSLNVEMNIYSRNLKSFRKHKMVLLSLVLISVCLFEDIACIHATSKQSDAIGNTPFHLCPSEGNQFSIEDLQLNPYPLVKGQNFSLRAKGQLNTTIQEGATMNIQVKKGPIVLSAQDKSLCKHQAGQGLIPCPMSPGFQELNVTLKVPNETPAGTYELTIHVDNGRDASRIICLNGDVQVT